MVLISALKKTYQSISRQEYIVIWMCSGWDTRQTYKVWCKLDHVGQSENNLLFPVKTSKFNATPQENWDEFAKVSCGNLITFDPEGVRIGHTKFDLDQLNPVGQVCKSTRSGHCKKQDHKMAEFQSGLGFGSKRLFCVSGHERHAYQIFYIEVKCRARAALLK